jgi:hypothetical protein
MPPPPRRWLWICALALAALPAAAQPAAEWTACRAAPTRACVDAEAMARWRSDAPPPGSAAFADWDRLVYLRLSELAATRRDQDLFAQARRSAASNGDPAARRSALRWVAAAQARAGFADAALATLEPGDDGAFAAEEIALALLRAGRSDDALTAVRRLAAPEAQIRALLRLARSSREERHLEAAAALIRALDDGFAQSATWPSVAIAYAELARIDDAQRVVRAIAVSYHRSLALAGVAALTRDARLLREARGYATGFDGRGHEDEVWAALARAEIALGLLDGAHKTLASAVAGAPSRALAGAIGELAAAHWLRGERPIAEALLDRLLGGSWTIGEARATLARRLLAADRFGDARQVSFLADEWTFDNLTAELALRQARSGAVGEALTTADAIQHPARRSPTLAEIAAMMPP